jgi:N-acetylmuramoyl-L-alanine amidase
MIMAKKIYISPSDQFRNVYATGNTNEKEQCKKIAKACYDFLKTQGFEVMCTYNDDMYARVRESNSFGADIHLAIHTNAFNGTITGGTQILLLKLNGEHKKVGQAVLDRLAPITVGTSHERLVKNDTFYEINKANGITVYCECEFHDTKNGSNNIINKTTEIGEAIGKGICDYYGVKIKTPTKTETTKPATTSSIKKGDLVSIKSGAKYYTGKAIPKWVLNSKWYVAEVKGNRAVIDKSEDGKCSINSPVNATYLTVAKKTTATIKVGSTVKVKKGAKTYDGKSLASFVYGRKHKVKQLNGNRAVITYAGITVCAIDVKNLTLVK